MSGRRACRPVVPQSPGRTRAGMEHGRERAGGDVHRPDVVGPQALSEPTGEGAGPPSAPEPSWVEPLTALGFVIAVLVGMVWALVLSRAWPWPLHRL